MTISNLQFNAVQELAEYLDKITKGYIDGINEEIIDEIAIRYYAVSHAYADTLHLIPYGDLQRLEENRGFVRDPHMRLVCTQKAIEKYKERMVD